MLGGLRNTAREAMRTEAACENRIGGANKGQGHVLNGLRESTDYSKRAETATNGPSLTDRSM